MIDALAPIKTTCSDCFADLVIDECYGSVTTTVPSNGRRGSKRVEARKVTLDAWMDAEGDLVMWDCPACGHADSYDLTQED
jgi:hypothetical protein